MKEEDLKKEGRIINAILYRRFKANKNFIGITLGPTGSGKSWFDLRFCEVYYRDVLKQAFPPENICFSIQEAAARIKYYWGLSDKERRGHLIIFEEGGANLGSLDFSKKEVKKFNQMMQVFRNMNIGIIFNLPYMFMLAKQTRTLAHMEFTMRRVDKSKGICIVAPRLLQYSQHKPEPYRKRPEVAVGRFMEKIDEITYNRPTPEIVKIYEERKNKFVGGSIDEVIDLKEKKDKRKKLTLRQERAMIAMAKAKGNRIGMIEELKKIEPEKDGHTLECGYYEAFNKGYNWEEFLPKSNKNP